MKQTKKIKGEGVILLPCPFCGGTPKVFDVNTRGYKKVYCLQCGSGTGGRSGERSLKLWNKRISSEDLAKILTEKIREVIADL